MSFLNKFDLTGKTIVVTGASSGIGQNTAILLSNLGATVVLLGRNLTTLKETAKACPGVTFCFPVDVRREDHIETLFKRINADLGPLDGMVHAAGISTTLPIKNIQSEKLIPFFETNVYSTIHLVKYFSKMGHFNKSGSSIVLLSSVMGLVGEIGKTIYSATKGAMVASAKSMALELAPKKIRINCIAPGVVESPMSKSAVYAQDEVSFEKIKALHPLGLGKPDDIAYTTAFLLSEAAQWITGTTITVDGGYTAK